MSLYATYADGELLGLLQQGDDAAFTEIFDRYWPSLYALAIKQLRSAHEADEVVQELFIELWDRRAHLQVTRSLAHWLAGAVKYKVLTIFSRRQAQSRTTGELPEHLPSTAATPGSLLELQELLTRLEASVRALPQRAQLVYRLSREEQLSNRDIAHVLQISEKTVENHMNRALHSLRHTLGGAAVSVLLSIL
jgi:RNA polymerase sigma-70 factor (family 1)